MVLLRRSVVACRVFLPRVTSFLSFSAAAVVVDSDFSAMARSLSTSLMACLSSSPASSLSSFSTFISSSNFATATFPAFACRAWSCLHFSSAASALWKFSSPSALSLKIFPTAASLASALSFWSFKLEALAALRLEIAESSEARSFWKSSACLANLLSTSPSLLAKPTLMALLRSAAAAARFTFSLSSSTSALRASLSACS
mmetsp:Transcript_12879/g.25583  ORF Transcript_12879/g.25583 Transcript_12879/m.25583 type:complete len:201 (-) Transcript_12879:681-1283(-)